MLGVPNGRYRTYADEYVKGEYSYSFIYNEGNQMLCVPYVAGVLALGFQIAPELSGEEMLELLLDTAYMNYGGNRFIYPRSFIIEARDMAKKPPPAKVLYIDNLLFVDIVILAVILIGVAVFAVLRKRKKF